MAHNLGSDGKLMEGDLVTTWQQVVSSVIVKLCNKSRKESEGYYHEEFKNYISIYFKHFW